MATRFAIAESPGAYWQVLRESDVLVPGRSNSKRKSTKAADTNLPVQLTSFIGRAHELEQVKRLLSTSRLLTLTGAGGCGKTRLALRVLADTSKARTFEDGIWWTDFAPLSNPALVPQLVAESLGVRERSNEPLTETICEYLQDQRALLALDNCEHLVAACAHLVEILLRSCPNVQIFATSREPLGVPGEMTWLVPSLSVPESDPPNLSAADLAQFDAVQLFIARATSASFSFALTDQNAPALLQVCRRLEGIPLAIELAAARVIVLTVEQIAAYLDDSFALLASNNRTAVLPRHQTLRAAIDWSYALLSEPEQVLFRRLSVFAGGFTLDAAAQVTGTEEPSAEKDAPFTPLAPNQALDLLAQLINKSLVVGNTPERGEARYRLLETIRQYAAEKLARAGETAFFRTRHRDWFLRFVENAELESRGANQSTWLNRLEDEHDNLRVALKWCEESTAIEEELRIASALTRFWIVRGYLREGREWLEKALAQGAVVTDAVRAKATHVAGTLISRQGDYAAARPFLEDALALRRKIGDRHGISISLNNLATVAINQADYPRARSLLEQSVALKRALGDKAGLAHSLGNLGEVARLEGNYDQASTLYEESLALFRELDDQDTVGLVLYGLGSLNLARRDYQRASGFFQTSLAVGRQLGNKWTIAMCIAGFAAVARARGESGRAARLLGASEAQLQAIGSPLEPADRSEFDRNVAETRAQLDPSRFDAVWAEGRAMEVEQAIKQALESDGSPEIGGTARDARPLSPDALRILALGSARVWRGERELTSSDWTIAKARELFFFLLCHPPQTKEQIGLALWQDASSSQLRNKLGVATHHLRRALGRPECVVFADDSYGFNRALDFTFDVEDFRARLAAARKDQSPTVAAQRLEQAVALYRGDFLDDLVEGEWFLALREELRREFLDALLALGKLHFDDAQYTRAAEVYRRAIAHDSYLESAHRELMRCYARQGERGQALRQYRSLLELMREELHAQPAPETEELFERLRFGENV